MWDGCIRTLGSIRAYVFVIEGSVEAAGEELGPRDGMGITGADEFPIKGETDAKVLIIEVPMEV